MKKTAIIIPVYNEEENINILYNEIKKELSNFTAYEIIFINDGSTDGSKNILKINAPATPNAIIFFLLSGAKFAAIRPIMMALSAAITTSIISI